MTTPDASTIREIVAELQGEIERWQPAGQDNMHVASGKAGLNDESGPLARVRMYQRVNSHLPIGWPTMPPGLLPKLRAYAQKITRRLLRWYINPLVDQQNLFNGAVAEALVDLSLRAERQERRLQEIWQRLQESSTSDRAGEE